MQVIAADQRYFQDFGWLKTHWLFSFDSYHDPDNIHWGKLRVFNDDRVSPGQGFGTHPHREMEIVSIILKGEITHRDNIGNEMIVRAGEIQRMSAGTGITHSEHNLGTEELELFQIWLFPHTKGLKPEYEQRPYEGSMEDNRIVPLVTGLNSGGLLSMHADANIYMANIKSGNILKFETIPGGHQFLYVVDGSMKVNGQPLALRDQARVKAAEFLNLEADADSRLIIVDSK